MSNQNSSIGLAVIKIEPEPKYHEDDLELAKVWYNIREWFFIYKYDKEKQLLTVISKDDNMSGMMSWEDLLKTCGKPYVKYNIPIPNVEF